MKKIIMLSLCLSFSLADISAQFSFETRNDIITEINQLSQVLVADLDNDGDLDLLADIYGKMVWFENRDNLFTTQHLIKTSSWALESVIADMDNDGDLDIVAISKNLAVYLNDGFGNFDEVIIAEGYSFTWHVAVADLDSDNRKDILISDEYAYNFYWFKNEGNSPFLKSAKKRTLVNFKSGHQNTVYSISLFDFDKNGTNDLIINSSYSKRNPYWYSNDGNAKFTEKLLLPEKEELLRFIVIDFDNDGDYDLLGNGIDKISGKGVPVCYYNDGNSKFNSSDKIGSHLVGYIEAANDFNGDGYIDVVFSSFNARLLASYINNGDQTFGEADTLHSTYPVDIRSCITVDFDKDGDIDIIAANFSSPDEIFVFENDGSGNFRLKQNISSFRRRYFPFNINDLDNDGDNDAVLSVDYSSNSNSYGVYIIENKGTAVFDLPVKIANLRSRPTLLMDIDNNGLNDIVGTDQRTVFYLKNKGANKFESAVIIDSSFAWKRKMLPADIDRNGFRDLLVLTHESTNEDSLFWYPNSSAGFNQEKRLVVADTIDVFDVADFDGDGFKDIVAGCGNEALYVLRSNDSGVPDIFRVPSTGMSKSLATDDLNGDGLVDIICHLYDYENSRYQFGWYRNLGNNRFDSVAMLIIDYPFSAQRYNYTWKINTGDINLDGYPEIVVTTPDDGWIFYNNGEGSFANAQDFFSSNLLAIEDMDGDGDVDIVGSSYGRFTLYWRENFLNSSNSSNRTICKGDSILFFNNWLFDAGTYHYSISNDSGGVDNATLFLEVDSILPEEIDIKGPVSSKEVQLENYSFNREALTDYFWNVENGSLQSLQYQNSADILWGAPGTGKIDIIAVKPKSGCKAKSSFFVEILKIENDEIIIFPNPAQNQIFVTSTWDPVIAEIVNMTGQTVIIASNKSAIDVSFLSAGIYIVLLKDSSGNRFGWKKLLIE